MNLLMKSIIEFPVCKLYTIFFFLNIARRSIGEEERHEFRFLEGKLPVRASKD